MRRTNENGIDLDKLFGIQRVKPNVIRQINAETKQVIKAIEDAEQQRKDGGE